MHFQLEKANEGWQLFSVKFDPAQVSTDQVRGILTNAGAVIIPAPVSS